MLDPTFHGNQAFPRHVPAAMVDAGDGSKTTAIGDRLLTTNDAADYLGCAPNTLAKARVYGGPWACPHVKIGHSVKYRLRDLEVFIQQRVATNTAQHGFA